MRSLATAAACLLLTWSAQARAFVLVTISKADQQMSVVVDGSELYRWPVSTGRRGYATPTGSFRPYRLEGSWFSRRFDNAPMPHSVFFYYGYAVHGTVEESRLGRPVSHGCVRLSRANAEVLFDIVRQQGFASSRVLVINGQLPGGAPWRMPGPAAPRLDRVPGARLVTPPPRRLKARVDFDDWGGGDVRSVRRPPRLFAPRHATDAAALPRVTRNNGFRW